MLRLCAPTNEHMVLEMPMKWQERISARRAEWTKESMRQYINESTNHWIRTNKWKNEWSELLSLCWATSSVSDLFAEVLFSSYFFSDFCQLPPSSTVSCTFRNPSLLFAARGSLWTSIRTHFRHKCSRFTLAIKELTLRINGITLGINRITFWA